MQITLHKNFKNYDNIADMPLMLHKIDSEIITISGTIHGELNARNWDSFYGGFTLGTLEREHIPDKRLIFMCYNNGVSRIDILPNGVILLVHTDNTTNKINLTGINYNLHIGTKLQLLNNWLPNVYEKFRYPSFKKHGNMVYLEGVISNGVRNAQFGVLPQDYRPLYKQTFQIINSKNKISFIEILPNGICYIYDDDDDYKYYSLNGIMFITDMCINYRHNLDAGLCGLYEVRLADGWKIHDSACMNVVCNKFNNMVTLNGTITLNISNMVNIAKVWSQGNLSMSLGNNNNILGSNVQNMIKGNINSGVICKLHEDCSPGRNLAFFAYDLNNNGLMALNVTSEGIVHYKCNYVIKRDVLISLSTINFYLSPIFRNIINVKNVNKNIITFENKKNALSTDNTNNNSNNENKKESFVNFDINGGGCSESNEQNVEHFSLIKKDNALRKYSFIIKNNTLNFTVSCPNIILPFYLKVIINNRIVANIDAKNTKNKFFMLDTSNYMGQSMTFLKYNNNIVIRNVQFTN
jgi:hypothetical protein